MLKKSLLAGIALISLNPIQAAQTTNPTHREPQNPTRHEPPQHEEGAAHHTPAHPTKDSKHCPCDGTGGKRAWVLIEAGDGCNKEKTPGTHHKPEPHHTSEPHHNPELPHKPEPHHAAAEEHHVAPHKPSLHPLPTREEEELAEKLRGVPAHIFKKRNSPDGESGKELDGKVYFQHLGIWKHDPNVHPADIISTDVKDRIRRLNEEAKKPQEPEKPASTEAARHHPVNIPDALGTTEGRVQSVHTHPTDKGKKREFGLGAPNRAQTGVTGKAIPEADTSGTKAAVPPPPPPPNIRAEID